jgi:hypothetical protein
MRLDELRQLSGADRFGHIGELRNDRLGLFRRMNEEGGDAATLSADGDAAALRELARPAARDPRREGEELRQVGGPPSAGR